MHKLFSEDANRHVFAASLIQNTKERNTKMKNPKFAFAKDSRLALMLKRLLGEERGAVAMEYIVIALLIGAAVVALVMVLSGSLRNAGSSINQTINSKTATEVNSIATELNAQRDNMNSENKTANEAGDKIGGDFGTK